VCSTSSCSALMDLAALCREVHVRNEFIAERFTRAISPEERKILLTSFTTSRRLARL
jgi:hypothetical protein